MLRQCRAELLFFMSREKGEKSMTTLVMQDMERIEYARYTIAVSSHPFPSRVCITQCASHLTLLPARAAGL